jgi:hypothetical protein
MKEYSNTFTINKNIDTVFELLINNNSEIMYKLFNFSDSYDKNNIVEPWIKNKRINVLKVNIPEIPDIISDNYFNKSKDICIKLKNYISIRNDNQIIVKVKVKPTNINSIAANIAYKLKLLKTKFVFNLNRIDDYNTKLILNVSSYAYIPPPFNELLEKFTIDFLIKILSDAIKLI